MSQQVIKLSDNAANRIKEIISNAEKKTIGVRVGVKSGGCAGMEYTMEYVNEISETDEIIEVDGAKVVIAPTAQMFLFGTEIDYESGLLESGFKFKNPNVSETCGCGESIKFDVS